MEVVVVAVVAVVVGGGDATRSLPQTNLTLTCPRTKTEHARKQELHKNWN